MSEQDFQSNLPDLIQTGGELAPYTPSQPLAPVNDGGFPAPIDYFGKQPAAVDQPPAGTLQAFGQALPAGITQQQLNQLTGQMGGLFMADMSALGHPFKVVSGAIGWFYDAIKRGKPNERKNHSYNLFGDNDPLATSFANAMHRNGATQEFVTSCLWWLNAFAEQMNSGSHNIANKPAIAAQGSAPISDTEYNKLAIANETYAANCEAVLRDRWGSSYEQNRASAQRYLSNLSEPEKAHFDQFTTGGVHALNSPEVIVHLYEASIGANNIPKGGPELATEIDSIENVMRTNRKAYNSDINLQARLRELYTLRDG